ncbi:MAG: hypothetical protein LBE03_00625 [Candidatus Nomurabacteria bacterium]|jgi:hypothetical protein|nr:hypothetical protein [Candidatus Nomurabacteria bacterium]
MFSRTILSDKKSEKIATHQRLVRAARRKLQDYLPENQVFPLAKEINHFEGKNGPDGLLSKHNVADEPHQFIDPKHPDGELLGYIRNHLYNLHEAYQHNDRVKMAFEAAWGEHMIVDGLTPAHQQPFKEQLRELDPRDLAETNSVLKRIFMPGDSLKEYFIKNWKKIGPKGLGTNHILFEAGIDFITMPLSPKKLIPDLEQSEVEAAKQGNFTELYIAAIHKIAGYKMFERYVAEGWTTDLAEDVRAKLLPEAVKMVTLGWIQGIFYGD